MLAPSFVTLALSAAAVIAVPTNPTYKACPVLKSPWTEHFGRTGFSSVNSWLWTNKLQTIDDRGVKTAQTSALFNRDEKTWAETPGVGLVLIPAAAKNLDAVKLAILYHDQNPDRITYVSTIQDTPCVVPGSEKWTSVDGIYNGEEKGKPLLDCKWSNLLPTERLSNPDTEIGFDKDESGKSFVSSNSVGKDPKATTPAIKVYQVRHLGVFIEQAAEYQPTSKLEVDYVNIKGTKYAIHVVANKTPVKMAAGEMNADVYSKGFCKIEASENWARLEDVKMVVAK
jgi:hypothetical protein